MTARKPTDGWALLAATVRGDSSAFEKLVVAHEALLRYVVVRRAGAVRCWSDLREVLDETWYQVLRRALAGRYDTSKRFSAWLSGLCLNVLQQRRLHPTGVPFPGAEDDCFDGPPDTAEPPDRVAEREELLVALRECLSRRGERDRRLYELIYGEGLSKVDAAKALGCSEAYVRQKLLPSFQRAMARCLAAKGFRGGATEGRA